jgi:pantoate--beta-alanine ligase
MKKTTQIRAAKEFSRECQRPLVLVPTMGALHEGHLALIRRAREIVGIQGTVAVSIFVNPLQFGLHEDLSRYPRPFEADATLCEQEGVNLLFHPTVEEMYFPDASVTLQETQLSPHLCGASRPGHFSGMATVVAKFFNILSPDAAIFGEKDWQQLAIIRRFVRDLNFSVEIVAHPIVREEDGLALSSRNQYLTHEERAAAPRIYQTLQATAAEAQAGEADVSKLLSWTRTALEAIPKAVIDYVEIVDETTLEPLSKIFPSSTARLLVAVKLGRTRLIDNVNL